MALTLPHRRAQEHTVAPEIAAQAHPEQLKLMRSPRSFHAPAAVPNFVPNFFRYWHLASLDAPTVAVVWSLAFAWVAHVHLAAWVLALQVLVVWVLYVGDRLLDARTGLERNGSKMRERHWFHWRHRRVLAPMAVVAACIAASIALRWMPIAVWGRDSVVGLASLAYLASVHGGGGRAQVFSKEMLVGILFTSGCALPAWSRSVAIPVVFFAALAWLNCWAIEDWETAAPGPAVARIAMPLALVGAAAAGCAFAFEPRAAVLLLAGTASVMLLAMLDRARGHMTAVTLRALADLVLLTPAILLAAARMAP